MCVGVKVQIDLYKQANAEMESITKAYRALKRNERARAANPRPGPRSSVGATVQRRRSCT